MTLRRSVCLFFPIPFMIVNSPFFPLSLLVVTQIRGHMAGSSPLVVPCILIARRFRLFLHSSSLSTTSCVDAAAAAAAADIVAVATAVSMLAYVCIATRSYPTLVVAACFKQRKIAATTATKSNCPRKNRRQSSLQAGYDTLDRAC